ncbi:F-box protein CPR1 [Linum grandiflorum]
MKLNISNFFSETETATLIGSCHGLLCFSLGKHRLGIVNPSTGERHTLSYGFRDDRRPRVYGFGYDKFSDDYKVVRILQNMSDHSHIAEIYGVRSEGSFTTIPLPDAADWQTSNPLFPKHMGVFCGNSLHWSLAKHVVHTIDLVSNTYRQLDLPEIAFGGGLTAVLQVGVVNMRLCFSGFFQYGRKIGVWVMEEYGNSESWNMIICIPSTVVSVSDYGPFVGSDKDKILFMFDEHQLLWYDPTEKNENHKINIIKVGTKLPLSEFHQPVFCLESLVKIFPRDIIKKKLARQKISH